MPRFVILEHDHPHLHWDLMLEAGNVLRTWRLATMPTPDCGPIAATALGDHRKHYLDYEGPVSGNRGRVRRCAFGDFDLTREDASQIALVFRGFGISGDWQLEHTSGAEWLFSPRNHTP